MPGRMICCFFCVLLPLAFVCGAETGANAAKNDVSWYLAADTFDVSALPAAKKSSGVLIPQLLLEKIQGSAFHYTLPEETVFSSTREQRDKRIKAVNDLQQLYNERDKLFFSVADSLETAGKYRDTTKKIAEAEKTLAKEIAAAAEQKQETTEVASGTRLPVVLWNDPQKKADGFSTASIAPHSPIAPQLQKLKVSGLIAGSVESIGAYVSIVCRLYVYPLEEPVCEIADAGSWEMLDHLLSSLADRLLPYIYGQIPAEIMIDITPPSAAAVMDRVPVQSGMVRQVFPGEHTFDFKADGFYPYTAVYTFVPGKKYKITVNLEEIPQRIISYGKTDTAQTLVFEGFDRPVAGQQFSLPLIETIGYTEMPDGANAWFIIPEITFAQAGDVPQYTAPLNPADMNDIIERRRNIMYGSLGALYLFLPVSMYFNGTYDNMMAAYNDGAYTDIDELNKIIRMSNITTWIGVGLGVNFAVHLVRYLIAVNRLTPQILKPDDIFTAVQETVPSQAEAQNAIEEPLPDDVGSAER